MERRLGRGRSRDDGTRADGGSSMAGRLAYLRRHRGWTQRDLALRSGIHQPEISRIETGATIPTEATLERLAAALGYRLTLAPLAETGGAQQADEHGARGTTMDAWQDRIRAEPGTRGGQPHIRGSRITVRDILEYLAGGMTPAQILADFPELDPPDIAAALAYAAAHLEPLPA